MQPTPKTGPATRRRSARRGTGSTVGAALKGTAFVANVSSFPEVLKSIKLGNVLVSLYSSFSPALVYESGVKKPKHQLQTSHCTVQFINTVKFLISSHHIHTDRQTNILNVPEF